MLGQTTPTALAPALCSASAPQLVTGELAYKADLFDYLCWLEEQRSKGVAELENAPHCVIASDGTPCFAKRYADAAKVAMNHDKGIQDAQTPNDKLSDREQ